MILSGKCAQYTRVPLILMIKLSQKAKITNCLNLNPMKQETELTTTIRSDLNDNSRRCSLLFQVHQPPGIILVVSSCTSWRHVRVSC